MKKIAHNEFHNNEVPSKVSVRISTDSQPDFGRSIWGDRKQLEDEYECVTTLERHSQKVKVPFAPPNAVISKPPENLPFAPNKVTYDSATAI